MRLHHGTGKLVGITPRASNCSSATGGTGPYNAVALLQAASFHNEYQDILFDEGYLSDGGLYQGIYKANF